MKFSFLFFGNKPDLKWALSRQMGISFAIAKLAPELTGQLPPWDYNSLLQSKEIFARNGFELKGLEGDQFNMDRIKFGLPGCNEDIALYQQMLQNMGKLGINLLCYNFMAGIGWYRTDTAIAERGGATVSGFDATVAKQEGLTGYGEISEDEIWDNYQYFIEKVMPVAEQVGVKMALHPDDPPVSPLRGIGRIFTTPENIRRAMALTDSPSHGLTFCQGTYRTMGADLKAFAQEFIERIYFVHIRDIEGNADKFQETFHDNGPTDMVEMMKHYKDLRFNGLIRSDHVPTMEGETNELHGYTMQGNLFGIGYLKGIMDALDIPFNK